MVEFRKPGYNRSEASGVIVKVREKPVKRIDPAKVTELLLDIIERLAAILLNTRFIGCDDVDEVSSASVTLALRLCALRLAFPGDDWKDLLHKRAAFLRCPEPATDSDAEFTITRVLRNHQNEVLLGTGTHKGSDDCCSIQVLTGDINWAGELDAGLLFVLGEIDCVIASLNCERREQTLSCLYEMVLNMVPAFVEDGSGTAALKLKQLEKLKKRSGSFYSPAHLVGRTVEAALAPLVLVDGAYKSASRVLDLKVLDPAMGAGIFLIHAYRYLISTVPSSTSEERLEIARQCIYGVDLDPLAVEVARLSLWLAVKEQMVDFEQDLDPVRDFPNLRVGNSLIGGRIDQCPVSMKNSSMKEQLDLWCAKWFTMPESNELIDSLNETLIEIAKTSKFFHWEIEFPEVFNRRVRENTGFDAVIGNPPWEISKPNSREFFGLVDPKYWSLGKQDAIAAQQDLLDNNPELSSSWRSLQNQHKLFARWVKKAPVQLDESVHPFAYQGSSDLNMYKLFCEQSFYLTRDGGSIALIVPAGLYSDSGARELRRLLLEKTSWSHLWGFDNTDGAFNIHRSFKYCIFVTKKAGKTNKIETSFLGQPFEYSIEMVKNLSPKWSVFSEIESNEALSIIERIYQNSDLLGSTKYDGSRIEYAREFDMTLDSKKFRARDQLESEGYVQDAYGNWLLGKWRSCERRADDASFVINSACERMSIALEDVVDTYLPLYEGRMVGQFTANDKHWISGKGRRAVWEKSPDASLGPQYLIHRDELLEQDPCQELKVGFLAVGCATNARTMIASCLSTVACGNSVPVLRLKKHQSELRPRSANQQSVAIENEEGHGVLCSDELQLVLTGFLNSFVFDFVIRRKMAGNNLNYFVIEECPLPKLTSSNLPIFKQIAKLVAQLNLVHPRNSRELSRLGYTSVPSISSSTHFRILRSFLDVLVANLFGLNHRDLTTILSDEGCGRVNPKGFYRMERNLQPEDRLPTLVLKHAFELEEIGASAMTKRIEEILTIEKMMDCDGSRNTSTHASVLDQILKSRNSSHGFR